MWQLEIIQDHIEEADETCEVQLVSPEATIIKSISKAEIIIRDSGKHKNYIVFVFLHNKP